MVEAVRKYERVCHVGTQQRSMFRNREASELLRNGRLGKLQEVHCHNWPGARPYSDFDLPGDADVPGIGAEQARQHVDRCGLAGSIWPQEAEQFALAHLEVHASHGGHVAKALGQAPDLNCGGPVSIHLIVRSCEALTPTSEP
jgi:hypothetical protein